MGTTLCSIHIYGESAPADGGCAFRSFSPGWLTCMDDLSEKDPHETRRAAAAISHKTDAPVLHFWVYDSESIWFHFFRQGKVVSSYSDDRLVANKKLFDIPALIGCDSGQKRRLSTILGCCDAERKITMLEEYLGVSLLYFPELEADPGALRRERSDACYQQYLAEEKALSGRAAPIALQLTAEYPGKLFWDAFGKHKTVKPHFFLHGYTDDRASGYHDLMPVRFTGSSLEASDEETFEQGRLPRKYHDSRFQMHYGTPSRVTFSDECPPGYRGKTMTLPSGLYPREFLLSGELLLHGAHRIYIADDTFRIIAKLSIKGVLADVIGNHILTVTGDSFCGYCYEPKAKIYIYEIVKKGAQAAC